MMVRSSRSGTYHVDLYLLWTFGLLFFLRCPANNSPQASLTTSEKVGTRTIFLALDPHGYLLAHSLTEFAHPDANTANRNVSASLTAGGVASRACAASDY